MANKYFIAGVGRVALYDNEHLYCNANTLVDSSMTLSVTAEDIRGGEGNKLLGQYFHDSGMSLKLTDALFNLEYIAMQTGSEISHNGADVFWSEELKVASNKLTLSKTAVPLVNGASVVNAWVSKVGEGKEKVMAVNEDNTISVVDDNDAKYCVTYKYTNEEAKTLTISSNFIPSTLHATLTVALYFGDSCDADAASKAGEVVIDVPRFQLNGAMDLTLSATGAAQSSLEGNALSSGCSGCSGEGSYATVSEVIFNAKWYDDVEAVIIEDNDREVSAGQVNEVFNAYAVYSVGLPRALAADKFTWGMEGEGALEIGASTGVVTGTGVAGQEYTITATVNENSELVATATLTVK